MLQNVFFSVYFYWRHNLQITSDRDFIFLGFLLKAFLQIVLINVDEISPVSDSSLSIVFIFQQIYQFDAHRGGGGREGGGGHLMYPL